jgi:hypothetical protein
MKAQLKAVTTAALERIELYFCAHPGTPSAVRRPQLFLRGNTWVALLGPNIENGIVGLGSSVESALRAFDNAYLRALHSPSGRNAS